MLFVGLFDRTTGALLLDCSPWCQGLTFGSNQHGCESLAGDVLRPLYDAFRIYDAAMPEIVVADDGLVIWRGRLEAPGLHISSEGSGTKLQGFGYWNALNDLPYTAFWSDTSLDRWRAVETTEISNRTPERYEIKKDNNTLLIAPKKGETFGAGAAPLPAIGSLMYVLPDGSGTQIQLIQFDLDFNAPVNWAVNVYRANAALSVFNVIFSVTSAGAPLTRSVFTSITADDRILFELFFNAAAAVAGFDTGTVYARITNMRLCATASDIANTVLTANRAAGTSVTATVVSTANMYVGQRLTINGAANPSESVIVQSITNSTQFVATFANGYVIGNPIGGSRLLASTIVKHGIGVTAPVNPTHLSSSTGGVQASSLDVTNAVYEDAMIADVVSDLADQEGWQAVVWDDKALHFEPVGTNSKAWYVDVGDLNLERSTDDLATSAYATYEDANGRTLRTATSSTAGAATRAGVDRRQMIEGQTTNSTIATLKRDAALLLQANPQPKTTFSVDRIYDASGARWPLWLVRAGDTLTLRNLPPGASASIDALRTFRLTRATYDTDNNTLAIEPELPASSLDALIGGL